MKPVAARVRRFEKVPTNREVTVAFATSILPALKCTETSEVFRAIGLRRIEVGFDGSEVTSDSKKG